MCSADLGYKEGEAETEIEKETETEREREIEEKESSHSSQRGCASTVTHPHADARVSQRQGEALKNYKGAISNINPLQAHTCTKKNVCTQAQNGTSHL